MDRQNDRVGIRPAVDGRLSIEDNRLARIGSCTKCLDLYLCLFTGFHIVLSGATRILRHLQMRCFPSNG